MEDIQTDSNLHIEVIHETQSEKQSQPSEEKAGFCYCGKDRNLNIVELLCANCNRWFHESCIGYQLAKLVPFITNYVFVCKNCSPSGLESFRRSQASIPQMCITAIANMRQNSLKEGNIKSIFSKDKEIIPFIEQYWESMTTMPRRVTQSWYSTVQRSLLKDVQITFTYEEHPENGAMFGLVSSDLYQIKPSYEAMGKLGALRLSEDGYAQELHFLHSHLDFLSEYMGSVTDELGERFYQDVVTFAVLAYYCWSLMRDTQEFQFKRKASCTRTTLLFRPKHE